jgi:hypothetical protein
VCQRDNGEWKEKIMVKKIKRERERRKKESESEKEREIGKSDGKGEVNQ